MKKVNKVIIGGSGPSLEKIDYKRLPKDAKIWRINDFFKEPVYFLGRRVDAVFNGGTGVKIIDRYHTFHTLSNSKTYDINFTKVFSTKFFNEYPDLFKDTFGQIRDLDNSNNIGLWPVIDYNRLFLGRYLFTGTSAIIYAILTGFDEIYIVGIDNDYDMGKTYAYSNEKTDKKFLEWVNSYHPKDLQWEMIKKYQEKSKTKIFCLSKDSPAAKLFPLAPIIRTTSRKPETKTTQNMDTVPSPWYPGSLKIDKK